MRLVRYLIALVLVLGGACVIGFHIGATMSEADPTPTDPVEIAKISITDAEISPVWHLGLGAGLALLGLLIAKPVFTITLGLRRSKDEKRSVKSVVHDMANPDAKVRHKAAKELTELADPATIPVLIKGLRDPSVKVRGQACEALLQMTGLDFDFIDMAGEEARNESVSKWNAWWAQNKQSVLDGEDPKSIGAGSLADAEPEEAPPTRPRRSTTGRVARKKGPTATPAPGAARTTPRPSSVGRKSPAPGRTSPVPGSRTPAPRTSPVPKRTPVPRGSPPPKKSDDTSESGRHLTVGELVRRKREKQLTTPPGGKWVEEKPSPAPPPVADAEPAEEVPEAILLSDDEVEELPPPDDDDELPPPPP